MSRVHLPPLHSSQLEIERSTARFKIVVAGRRFGKTRYGTWKMSGRGIEGGTGFWVAPRYKLARPGWRDLRGLATQIPGAEVRRGAMEVTYQGGGWAAVRTGSDPDDLRSEGLSIAILDEAAMMKPEVWSEAIRPSLMDRQGEAMFISTPKGIRSWFYDLVGEAESKPDWDVFHFTSYDNPFLAKSEIDAMRDELGDMVFRQEALGEFVDFMGQIFRAEWIDTFRQLSVMETLEDGEDVEAIYYRAGDELARASDCSVHITCDPALSLRDEADFTAFAVWGVTPGGKLLVLEVLRGKMEAPDIVPTGERLVTKWGASWIGFESVAYQKSLIQYARRAGLPVRELKADKDKVSRSMPLAARMEAGDVFFRADAPWLEAVERELLMFPHGDHDDQVDALSYGVTARAERRRWAAY